MPILFDETAEDARLRPKAFGGSGTNVRAGSIDDLDQNSDLRGDAWYGDPTSIGVADKMMRDPHVRKSIDYISDPLRAAHWHFQPGGDSELDQEIADFCSFVFFENLNWDAVLKHILKYKVYGFSLFEITDDIRTVDSGRFPNLGTDQAAVITGMHHRPSWTLQYWHQSKRNPEQVDAITQWIIGSDGEKSGFRRVRAERLLRFTENQDGANYEGLPTLRSAYGAWKCRIQLMIIQMIRAERQGVGIPTIKLPESAIDEDIDAAQTILSEMRAHEKGYLILPHGYEFSWETTTGGEAGALSQAIEQAVRDISYNVGAGFMNLGQTVHGSFALAQSQQGQFEIGLEGDARFIADTFNNGSDGWSPVERLVRLNYGADAKLPRMKVGNMPTRDWSKILPVINSLSQTGVIVPDEVLENFTRQVLRLPKADPATARQYTRGPDSPFAENGNPTADEPEVQTDGD